MKLWLAILALTCSAWAALTLDSTPRALSTATGATNSLAIPGGVVSGELVWAHWTSFNQSTAPTIADTVGGGNTWTLVLNGTTNSCGFDYLWVTVSGATGADTITVTAGGTSFQNMNVGHFTSGTVTTDGVVDTTWSSSATTITTGNITTGANGDILLSGIQTCNSQSPSSLLPNSMLTGQNAADSTATQWRLSGANGTYAASFHWGGGSSSGHVWLVALKSVASLAVSTTALPDAVSGQPYSANLNAQGGSGAYTWAVTSGTLPPGLSLSGNTISGTPTASAVSCCTFQVTDGASATATASFSIAVGTSFNTVGFIQSIPGCSGLGTVTIGHSILFIGWNTSVTAFTLPALSSSRVTWNPLPMSPAINGGAGSQAEGTYAFWGVVNSTGTDTLTITNGQSPTCTMTEFSNVQTLFDSSSFVSSQGTGATNGATIATSAITSPVTETLWAGAAQFNSSVTLTAQSPFTSSGATSGDPGDGYDIGVTAASHTASFLIGGAGATDGHWAAVLLGLRPSKTGTAPSGPAFQPRHTGNAIIQ